MSLIILRQSNIRQINDPIPVVPFKFDKQSLTEPSKFEYIFTASDNRKYVYGFSSTMHHVCEEYLYVYKTNRPSLVFERVNETYKYSRNEKRYLESIQRMNTPNKLFLATATAWNVESTTIPYKWLASGIDTYTNNQDIQSIALNMYRTTGQELIDFTTKLLHQADINISNVKVESRRILESSRNAFMPQIEVNGQVLQPNEQYEIKISTDHAVTLPDGSAETYNLSLEEESLGTQQLFYIAPLLKQSLEAGKTLIIDEIDRSLHPLIVKSLINLFRKSTINKHGAQLIFTTHETTLLSLDTFRRDQIYFTEKNNSTAASDLYSLDEFSVRKTDNIEKGYLLGRYGAIPFLHTEELI